MEADPPCPPLLPGLHGSPHLTSGLLWAHLLRSPLPSPGPLTAAPGQLGSDSFPSVSALLLRDVLRAPTKPQPYPTQSRTQNTLSREALVNILSSGRAAVESLAGGCGATLWAFEEERPLLPQLLLLGCTSELPSELSQHARAAPPFQAPEPSLVGGHVRTWACLAVPMLSGREM